MRLDPQGSEGDPEWFFVTPETYLTTFVSETFWLDEIWFWHPQAPPSAPRGQKVTPNEFLSPLKHTWQLLLAKLFDLMKFDFDTPRDPWLPPWPPGIKGWSRMHFLSSLKHTWQLLLAKFFDLMKFEFEPLRGSPECPRAPRGRGSNSNSLFRAPMHEDLTLSIWFGYYKRYLRSFAG